MSQKLPYDLEAKKASVLNEFLVVADSWSTFEDELIPEKTSLTIDILDVLLALSDFCQDLVAEQDVTSFIHEHLFGFYYHFEYGPNGDENNYLDLDEGSVKDCLWDAFPSDEEEYTKENLKRFRAAIVDLRKKVTHEDNH